MNWKNQIIVRQLQNTNNPCEGFWSRDRFGILPTYIHVINLILSYRFSYKWFVPFTYITSSSPSKVISSEINMTSGEETMDILCNLNDPNVYVGSSKWLRLVFTAESGPYPQAADSEHSFYASVRGFPEGLIPREPEDLLPCPTKPHQILTNPHTLTTTTNSYEKRNPEII